MSVSVKKTLESQGLENRYDVILPKVERYAIMLSLPFDSSINFAKATSVYEAVEIVTKRTPQWSRKQSSQVIATRITLNFAERSGGRLESIYCYKGQIKIALSFESEVLLQRFTEKLNAMIEKSTNCIGHLVNDKW